MRRVKWVECLMKKLFVWKGTLEWIGVHRRMARWMDGWMWRLWVFVSMTNLFPFFTLSISVSLSLSLSFSLFSPSVFLSFFLLIEWNEIAGNFIFISFSFTHRFIFLSFLSLDWIGLDWIELVVLVWFGLAHFSSNHWIPQTLETRSWILVPGDWICYKYWILDPGYSLLKTGTGADDDADTGLLAISCGCFVYVYTVYIVYCTCILESGACVCVCLCVVVVFTRSSLGCWDLHIDVKFDLLYFNLGLLLLSFQSVYVLVYVWSVFVCWLAGCCKGRNRKEWDIQSIHPFIHTISTIQYPHCRYIVLCTLFPLPLLSFSSSFKLEAFKALHEVYISLSLSSSYSVCLSVCVCDWKSEWVVQCKQEYR